nr:TIGR02300 family protein [Roseospira visakhapatnamensis]
MQEEVRVAKPEWGTKRSCGSCGARYYDMRRQPIVCPKCGAVHEEDAPVRARRARPAVPDKKPKAVPVVAAAALEEVEDVVKTNLEAPDLDDTEDEAGDMMEDASDLGEDDDDMAEVIDHLDSDGEDE